MKIAINTDIIELLNDFIKISKEKGHEAISVKAESTLFQHIEDFDVDAYILSNDTPYFKKAVDFIKKCNPHTPIIALLTNNTLKSVTVDYYMPMLTDPSYSTLSLAIIHNFEKYVSTFITLQKLTAKLQDLIEFGNCIYDPNKRILTYKGKEIKKFSAKEGGIFEILAINYKELVKKELILEKVWHKTDYFAGRSMDVYITYLRNIFKENNIKLTIKKITNVGLILE